MLILAPILMLIKQWNISIISMKRAGLADWNRRSVQLRRRRLRRPPLTHRPEATETSRLAIS